jgi:pyridoxine kinase
MATFVLQSLGCDVAALNTVHFSKDSISRSKTAFRILLLDIPFSVKKRIDNRGSGNHTGYRQVAGTKASAKEIHDIYEGLKRSYLTDFHALLSGYAPSADAVQAVGVIARDLQTASAVKPGSFFWGTQRPSSPRERPSI